MASRLLFALLLPAFLLTACVPQPNQASSSNPNFPFPGPNDEDPDD